MQRFFSSRVSVVVLLVCITVCYAVLHGNQLSSYLSRPENLYKGEPLLTTPDGYYFLRQAEDVANGTYSGFDGIRNEPRNTTPPLMATLLAGFSSISGVPRLTAAFYFSPVLAFLLIPVMGLWGASIGKPRSGLLAGLIASCSEAWFSRVLMGAFDTDSLILPLLLLALLCLSLPVSGSTVARTQSPQARPVVRWLLYVCGAAVALLVLRLWWPQGSVAMTGLVAGTYAASCVLPSNERLERLGKALLLFGGIAFSAYMLLGNPQGELGMLAASIKAHMELAVKGQSSAFAETGATVSELVSTSFGDMAQVVAAHWAVMVCSLIGYGVFTWRHYKSSLMVGGPLIVLGLAAFWAGNRFLMFLAPCFGIGIVFFVQYAVCPLVQHWHDRLQYAAWGLLVLLAFPVAYRCASFSPVPIHNTSAVALASVIDTAASPDSFVWNWWGPGYMQAYFGKRQNLVDGGKQQPEPVFIASVPFASNDPVFARNWIKFFSVHHNGLFELTGVLGSKPQAVQFLKNVLAHPEILDDPLMKNLLPKDRDWKKWLFPEREAYIILHSEMLVRSTWNELGRWNPVTRKGPDVAVHMTPATQVRLNRELGVAADVQGNAFEYSKLYFVHPQNLSHDAVRENGPVAMMFWNSPFFYTLQKKYFDCLAYRLLFVYPENTPGFEAVAYNPYVGGVWRVQ